MNYKAVLRSSFLFCDLDDDEFESALSLLEPEINEYVRGETIFSPEMYSKKIGFVISGECEVLKCHESSRDIKLKTVSPSGSFGIIGAISDSAEYPTTVRAKKSTTVLFLTRDDLYCLIEHYHKISLCVIRFLADRIHFLNEKIATFSSADVVKKLSSYLVCLYHSAADTKIPFNKAKAAQEIGVGRASLYRALSYLSDHNLIVYDNKYLQIVDFVNLERISK